MYAEINGLRMFFEDRGSSGDSTDVIVFLHGFPLDHSIWRHQLDYFSTGYRCIAPDLRGFGASSELKKPPQPTPLTVDTFAADIVALLDHLKIKSADFVGLSMGGYIALAIWRRLATRRRVRRLIFSNTRAAGDTAETKANRKRQAELVKTKGMRPYADEMLPRLLAPENMERCGNEVRHMIERTHPDTIVATLEALATRKDMTDWLRRVQAKTLVIAGEKDVISPPSDSEVIAREVDGAKLVVIPGAGHLTPLEQPNAFNEAMYAFLR
ncbi:MAG: alpha/beta hydrolase [Thermoflexales bacterium]|nr:alpha/beta hydrolase [Thermoflexales bacterium]MDW8350440.1 alpha/beta fold hydrolase [Anaerolineae bacterium]